MKKIKRILIKEFKSSSGKLVPFTFNKKFPIKVKRIFFIHGAKNKIRGNHAHKKCTQLFIAISGKILLEVKSLYSTKKYLIGKNSRHGILVPSKYWCSAKFLTKHSVLMVATDQYYKFDDYLETFDDYKKYLLKK
jgi:dTDP-4-dehydrorhamnose 3,5-epimerase-like enzyme